jgi:hypothetical protein
MTRGVGVFDNFQGLPLTLPGIEVQNGRKLGPKLYWAIRTALCSALRSDAEQLPYQAVMLSMVQL